MYTVTMSFVDNKVIVQQSCNLDSAARGAVAQVNLWLDRYTEGSELCCSNFAELLDYCNDTDDWCVLTLTTGDAGVLGARNTK